MRNVALLLLLILIFLGCGWLGFQIANQTRWQNQPVTSNPPISDLDQQFQLLLINVDQMKNSRPKLLSIWFLSSFAMEGQPLTLSYGQVFPGKEESQAEKALAQSFRLDAHGVPAADFWKAFQAYNISAKEYVIVDTFALNQFLHWVNQSDVSTSIKEGARVDLKRGIEQSCKKLNVLKAQSKPVAWDDLIPSHFRSNLPFDTVMLRWAQITDPKQPVRCEYLPTD